MPHSHNASPGEAVRRSIDSTATRPNYLNLNASFNLTRLNQSSPSSASSRLVSRMTTLHEEKPPASAVSMNAPVGVGKEAICEELVEDKVFIVLLITSLVCFHPLYSTSNRQVSR